MIKMNLSSQFTDYVLYHDSITRLYLICVSLSVCLISYGFSNSPIRPIVDPEVELSIIFSSLTYKLMRRPHKKCCPLVRSSDTLSFYSLQCTVPYVLDNGTSSSRAWFKVPQFLWFNLPHTGHRGGG